MILIIHQDQMDCLLGISLDELQKLTTEKLDFSVQVNPGLNGQAIISQVKFKERVAKASRILVLSLQELITCHIVFAVLMILSIIAVVLGAMMLKLTLFLSSVLDSVRVMRKKLAFVSTCQIFGLVFLLTIKGGILFGVLIQWHFNLEIGISFFVQKYNPFLHLVNSIDGIQIGLNCCGRGSPEDYQISNDFFVPGYVPTSCCNTRRFYSTYCGRMLHNSKLGEIYQNAVQNFVKSQGIRDHAVALPNQTIPIEYAYQIGCYTIMHESLKLALVILFALLMLLDICTIASAFTYLLLSQALLFSMKQSNSTSLVSEVWPSRQSSVRSSLSSKQRWIGPHQKKS
ncbi:hypothetical protein Ciccas_002210 [Cichlidogyrus casuarinus]|uniref:Tetraspanin n=1 Tax=Cichlidogyrus casuarinus TaxID=1844966 RepID=A0ABD2QIG4_9PLAT